MKFLLSPHRERTEDPAVLIPLNMISNKVVADLGCGVGYYSRYLSKYAAKLYAIDESEEMLRKAIEVASGNNVEFIKSDISNTHLKAGSIDVVLLANVFHDVKSEDVVNEIRRILRDNGILIIIDWKKEQTDVGPPYELRMDADDYKRYFSGFYTVKVTEASEYQYEMLMKKGA
jgi:ubiquinone/menaquinone biosynthesis C-methylase UbiE